MSRFENLKQNVKDYLFDHPIQRNLLDYALTLMICGVSAFLQAYIFRAFIVPPSVEGIAPPALITGGVSGTSQIITKIIQILNLLPAIEGRTIQAFLYVFFNIPLFFLGFKGVGKRFAVFSFVNVFMTSFFIQVLPENILTLFDVSHDMLSRALFAGLIGGVASAIAFVAEISSGGLDVIVYYIANTKSTSVGKYSVAFNSVILTTFTLLVMLSEGTTVGALNSLVYSIIYSFTASTVVDAFNSRNKKTQIQIISSKENLPKIIMANFPHGCTIVPAIGGFSGDQRNILYVVVSAFEVKGLVKLVRDVDPNSFISTSSLNQVYGRFFIRPVK